MAELLEVPILKGGIHNGFEVQNLQAAARDTMEAMPYLLEAQYKGAYRGDANQRFNDEIPPSFLNLQHDVIGEESTTPIPPERLKELTLGVQMEVDTRLFNGEEWVIGNFRNVKPELAKLLSGAYPGRSVEILPNFQNPDTGQIYPVVLRSVAFLDPQTDPAVPQTPGYSVKLADDRPGVQVVSCEMPKINQSEQEETTMPEKDEGTVKLSQEDIQRFDAMEKRLKALETENGTLKGVVNEMKDEKDSLSSEVLKFQAKAHQSEIDAYLMKLEKDFNLTPVALEKIRPVLSPVDGVVKMSADSEPIPVESAYMQSIEDLFSLAVKKDALFVPVSTELPKGKQSVTKLSKFQQEESEIKKLQADAKEHGQELSYADARLKVVSTSNSILDKIEQARHDEGGE
jgi:hypothetical protein